LLDVTIDGARGILFNVTGGNSLTLFEVTQAAAIIKETAHPDVNLIFGAVIDPSMGDDIRITVIATGFESAGVGSRMQRIPLSEPAAQQSFQRPARQLEPAEKVMVSVAAGSTATPAQTPVPAPAEFAPRTINTDDLDIPTFLRKHLQKDQKGF
jgi:cell division protein FtsZ